MGQAFFWLLFWANAKKVTKNNQETLAFEADRLRLEFFGPEALVGSKINEGLLPYLQERFYFRRAWPRMNSKG